MTHDDRERSIEFIWQPEAQSETQKEPKAFIAAMNRRFRSNGRGRKSA